jgi:hypothetical protein
VRWTASGKSQTKAAMAPARTASAPSW